MAATSNNTLVRSGILITVLTAAVFGLHPIGTKLAYEGGANLFFLILVATFFRGFILAIFCTLSGIPWVPGHRSIRTVCSGAFFQLVTTSAAFASQNRTVSESMCRCRVGLAANKEPAILSAGFSRRWQ